MNIRNSIALPVAFAATVGLAGCTAADDSPQIEATTTVASRTTTAPSTATSTAAPSGVVFSCSQKDASGNKRYGVAVTLPRRPDGVLDYSSSWAGYNSMCEAMTVIRPVTDLEKRVNEIYASSSPKSMGYTYASCMVTDPDSVFARPGFVPSPQQIPERSAALTLCPDHPQAEIWTKGLQRAQPGNSFRDGTFIVGRDVQPGTYAIDAPLTGCYWERQDRTGEIIDNNFITSAARVEVTISSSDYGFMSKGCGTWISVNA